MPELARQTVYHGADRCILRWRMPEVRSGPVHLNPTPNSDPAEAFAP